MLRSASRDRVFLALAILITLYSGLLRLDALFAKYGTLDRPRWAAALTHGLAPVVPRLRPFAPGWPPEARPYHGGDPINYLRAAREMEHFYQAHVREPVFLALTRAWLVLLSDQDVAISYASLVGSMLAVFGTFLVASALMPRPAALAAAFLVAVDYDMITWGADGWRDDTFTATVLWTAWAALRLRRAPTWQNAALFGGLAAIACLTRITALSFVLPALMWLVLDAPADARRRMLKTAGIALGVCTALVAPYLISCAIGTGDPFIAINYHTVYYRAGEGLPAKGTMSAAEYIGGKFARRPLATFDTGINGLFIVPFTTKWEGLAPMLGAARWVFVWSGAAGLLLMPFTAAGRLTLVVLFSSLLPYAFTWNIGGGSAWRFTMHAYPLYIIAAMFTFSVVWRAALTAWREPRSILRKPSWRTVVLAAVVMLCALAVPAVYAGMPWLVVREAIAQGEDVSIETGPRDRIFYRDGWSTPHSEGIIVRISRGERAIVNIPLPSRIPYDLVLRLDPVAPDAQQRVSVLFNRHFVNRSVLTWNPERVGTYRIRLQPEQVRVGRNEIVLIPEPLVPAGSAGRRFAWLPPADPIGIRLWYVRLLPNPH